VFTEDAALVVTVRSDAAGASVGETWGVRFKHGSSSTVPPPCCTSSNQPKSIESADQERSAVVSKSYNKITSNIHRDAKF
jgi:hypothetical protein